MTPAAATTSTTPTGPTKATLVDLANCIGCRACQVACKQWNDRDGEQTEFDGLLGMQNPVTLSAKTLTLISYHELPEPKAPGGLNYVFAMRRCLHCLEPACVSACPTTALHRREDGPVVYEESKCIGCRYCIWACPWGVPTAEWSSLAPKISKCTHCADRIDQPLPASRNGATLTADEQHGYQNSITTPACVKACPADALRFGERADLLKLAHDRIAKRPDRYVDHVYGEKEAGGTSVIYISPVPFDKIGFPKLREESYPGLSHNALHAVPPAVLGVATILSGSYAFLKRRAMGIAKEKAEKKAHAPFGVHDSDHDHPEFEPLPYKLLTPFNWFLLAVMAFGGISLLARFALGLGGSTNLSDTYAWGLWIVFDLVWIAVAAGAFASAGLIYVFQRKDLYSLGRAAVLMGLLSYSFVTVTLIADLGLPWHFYQLALNAPEQSAMFEVSWCVGLYVSILLLEFLPVPFERFGYHKLAAIWQQWSGVYVAFAVTLFIYLLSRNVVYAAMALALFSFLAYRANRWRPEPIMLAIAAVTLSTMHQSSLGSLFLLMPDKLAPQWWTPRLPINFFLSAIAAGTGLIIVVGMWMAKAWNRRVSMPRMSAMGSITFWALVVYFVFRLGDMAYRQQFAGAFSGRLGALFLTELIVGGVVPLLLLGTPRLRTQRSTLFLGALLATLGVVFNRINVVILAMDLRGAMPQVAPESYSPSIFEWGISLGLIAATIFLFGLAARYLPVLPKEQQPAHGVASV